jgi:hypothetical protein
MHTKTLVGKSEGKKSLGTHMSQWMDSTQMDLKGGRCKVVNWIHLAEDRDTVAGCCEHSHDPSGFINERNLLTNWATISFIRTLLDGVFSAVMHFLLWISFLFVFIVPRFLTFETFSNGSLHVVIMWVCYWLWTHLMPMYLYASIFNSTQIFR